MKFNRFVIPLLFPVAAVACAQDEVQVVENPVDYVTTLMGTLSDHSFSTGNTYPATAVPWGMNFWTPQTGPMGDGWTYSYDAHLIRGLKQTHQPSPWINDYGQFSVMPVKDASKVDQDARASWFSHKGETAKPYYYQVYLADHDVNAELTPSDRAAKFRFTFPESGTSGVVIDAFDKGSYVKVLPDSRTVVGYTTRNSGGVPENFRNWFVLTFDKPFESFSIYDGGKLVTDGTSASAEYQGNHAVAVVKFSTVRDEKVNVDVASSFISEKQAYTNLKEVSGKDFDAVKDEARARWNDVLGRITVGGGTLDQYRTFYSCLYRSVLSRASSMRWTRPATSCTTARTTARYAAAISIPTPASGIRSWRCSLC